MATSTTRATLKQKALGINAQCMHSAHRCSVLQQREMRTSKMKVHRNPGEQGPARIRSLLVDARMDYYHSVYQAKLREQEAKR